MCTSTLHCTYVQICIYLRYSMTFNYRRVAISVLLLRVHYCFRSQYLPHYFAAHNLLSNSPHDMLFTSGRNSTEKTSESVFVLCVVKNKPRSYLLS